MTIPIIFPYRQNTATWDELKYAIRSFELNFKDDFDMWIIGPTPKWFKQGNIIPLDWFKFQHNHTENKNCNINNKFLLASNLFRNFIWVADDQYLLRSAKTQLFKCLWYIDDFRSSESPKKPTPWQQLLINTYEQGLELGYKIHYNFEAHMPIYIDSKYARLTQEKFDISSGKYLFKQAYCMVVAHYDKTVLCRKCNQYKLGIYSNRNVQTSEWSGKMILNFNDRGLKSEGLKEKIQLLFPIKSKFERNKITNLKRRIMV